MRMNEEQLTHIVSLLSNIKERSPFYREKYKDYVWDCKDCLMIHDQDVAKHVMGRIKEMGITEPDDPRIKDLFPEAAEIYEKKRSSA